MELIGHRLRFNPNFTKYIQERVHSIIQMLNQIPSWMPAVQARGYPPPTRQYRPSNAQDAGIMSTSELIELA
jgi:hypothetical protein